MRKLLLLDDARVAQSLLDYLESRGIHCKLEQSELGMVLYLLDESKLVEVEAELRLFAKNPFDPRYAEASWQRGKVDSQIDYKAGYGSLTAHLFIQSGPLTLLVLGLCGLIFGLQQLGIDLYPYLSFHENLAQLTGWQLWRLVTPAFLHFSMLHLIFNLMWWWYLGGLIERQMGASKLLVLLLAGAALPNLLEFFITGPDFGGLSGVVYALVGYVWLQGKLRPEGSCQLPDGVFGFMLVWLVLGMVDVLGTHMANAAHLGGLAVGLLQGWHDGRKARP